MSFTCGCEDGPEWVRVKEQRARKPHRCWECGAPIKPGDLYEYVVGKWEGDVSVFRTCEPCADLRDSYAAQGYCYTYGSLWEDHLDELLNSGRQVPEGAIQKAREKARGARPPTNQ